MGTESARGAAFPPVAWERLQPCQGDHRPPPPAHSCRPRCLWASQARAWHLTAPTEMGVEMFLSERFLQFRPEAERKSSTQALGAVLGLGLSIQGVSPGVLEGRAAFRDVL